MTRPKEQQQPNQRHSHVGVDAQAVFGLHFAEWDRANVEEVHQASGPASSAQTTLRARRRGAG